MRYRSRSHGAADACCGAAVRWLVAVAALAPWTVRAQLVPDAGSILRQNEPPALTLPKKPPPEIKLEPALPELKAEPELRFNLRAFRITGASVFAESELLALVAEYVGREAGFAELEQAAARITRYYRERGYPLARAYLPAQDIDQGIVEIAVLEGRLGQIQLRNQSRVRETVLRAYFDGLRGRLVLEPALERKLLLIYDLPGVVPGTPAFTPGKKSGETDLALELAQGRGFSGNVAVDNFGSRFTGRDRLNAQLSVLSPAGLGDRLTFDGTKGWPGLDLGRLAYQVPLGGDGLRAGAAYTELHYRLGGSFAPLDASGDAHTKTFNLSYPIVRSRDFNVSAQASSDRRNFSDRQNATETVSDKSIGYHAITLSIDLRDTIGGGGNAAIGIGYGRGKLSIDTPAVLAVDAVSARTNGSYGKWSLNALRLQRLTERASLYFSFNGQVAGNNLDSSEKIVLGGPYGVRAYPQGEVAGDSGYVLSAEAHYDMPAPIAPGTLQLLGFIDHGAATISRNPFLPGDNHRRLSAAGAGVVWSHGDSFQLRFTFAARIGNAQALTDSNARSRAWLQVTKYL